MPQVSEEMDANSETNVNPCGGSVPAKSVQFFAAKILYPIGIPHSLRITIAQVNICLVLPACLPYSLEHELATSLCCLTSDFMEIVCSLVSSCAAGICH